MAIDSKNERLIVKHPTVCCSEVSYIARIVLGDWLGVEYDVVFEAREDVMISAGRSARLHLPCVFFKIADRQWLGVDGLPKKIGVLNHTFMSRGRTSLPVVEFRENGPEGDRAYSDSIDGIGRTCKLRCDVLGTAFFWVSRYEEAVLNERDEHDRFPAFAGASAKFNVLRVPIVDVQVEVLRDALESLWPKITRPIRQSPIVLTCDVDHPYSPWLLSMPSALRKLMGDLVKRRSMSEAWKTCRAMCWLNSRANPYDPNDTFEWMFELCEAAGVVGQFHFIAGHSGGSIDGCYSIRSRKIRRLIGRVAERGHVVGLHGSYNTYRNTSILEGEFDRLRMVCDQAGVQQESWPNRQHYLRWDSTLTPRILAEAGLSTDSTMAFADEAGFRCGTSKAFTMYDLIERKSLPILQRPLIAMEVSLTADRYMGLGKSEAATKVLEELKQASTENGGTFMLLWHNSELKTMADRRMLRRILNVEPSRFAEGDRTASGIH